MQEEKRERPEKEILTRHTTGSQHKSSLLLYSACIALAFLSLFLSLSLSLLYFLPFAQLHRIHLHLTSPSASLSLFLTPIQSTSTLRESECNSKKHACMPSVRYSVSFSFPQLIHQRVNILLTTREHLEREKEKESHIPHNWPEKEREKSVRCRDSREAKVARDKKKKKKEKSKSFSCIRFFLPDLKDFLWYHWWPFFFAYSPVSFPMLHLAAERCSEQREIGEEKQRRERRRRRGRRRDERRGENERGQKRRRMNGPKARVKMKTNVH